jgi:hypothetical protein
MTASCLCQHASAEVLGYRALLFPVADAGMYGTLPDCYSTFDMLSLCIQVLF